MRITIELQEAGIPTQALVRHLKSIAEVFSRNWQYDSNRVNDYAFLEVKATVSVPDGLTRDLCDGANDLKIAVTGGLRTNHLGAGFHAYLTSKVIESNRLRHPGEPLYIGDYPCAHVPVPPGFFRL